MTETEEKLMKALMFANEELTKLRIIELDQNLFIRKLQAEIAELKGLNRE